MADIKDDELPVIDLAKTDGYVVDDSDEDDPSLIMPDGSAVQTWRENYPYEERMSREEYEITKRALQIELLKWQNWTKETGQRHIILFEGRDAAGKGGTIKRFNEHLNPRARAPWLLRSLHRVSPPPGTSSVISSTSQPAEKSSSLTVLGTTVPVLSESWASARNPSMLNSYVKYRCWKTCFLVPVFH